jgi:hypothetical protein
MPMILRLNGIRVVIWPNDHRPAHVHVVGAVGEAVFLLHCPDGPPTLRESFGFRMSEVNRIEELLGAKVATLCAAWSEIHGHY